MKNLTSSLLDKKKKKDNRTIREVDFVQKFNRNLRQTMTCQLHMQIFFFLGSPWIITQKTSSFKKFIQHQDKSISSPDNISLEKNEGKEERKSRFSLISAAEKRKEFFSGWQKSDQALSRTCTHAGKCANAGS